MPAARAAARSPQPKSTQQVRKIFGLSRSIGMGDELLRDTVESVIKRTRHISELTKSEADQVIDHLLSRSGQTPRRTVHYRRAKAGVEQVVQQGQLNLIAELASQRNWSAEALKNFCIRQCGHFPLRTTKDANKVIEALKKMNRRDGKWSN